MKNSVQFTEAIDPIKKGSPCPSPWRCRAIIISLAFGIVCLAISPTARAVDPPPDGGYPNGNTAEGEDALFNLDTRTGISNTAIGAAALFSNTEGRDNTANGAFALYTNTGSGNTATGSLAMEANTTGGDNTANGYAALLNNTEGSDNTATGRNALILSTTGSGNTATGAFAMQANTTGGSNTATGASALYYNETGSFNTATGYEAMQGTFNSATGSDNTATGYRPLFFNSAGMNNTANGVEALLGNSTGNNNTATGFEALFGDVDGLSTGGSFNTANGAQALFSNTTGGSNTASGYLALFSNTTGSFNLANGVNALFANSTGSNNVANGFQALNGNTIGFANTAIGVQALFSNTTGSGNTANGVNALYNNTTGTTNIAVGVSAGANLTTGNNNIDIGNFGVAGESKKIRIGTTGTHNNTYIAGIYGVTVSRGIGVIVDSTGHLGTTTSSARFKDNIKPMDKTSEVILSLQPVTFRYKHELDPEGIPQFGLVAEEVAKVNPDLVARDEKGKPYTVRYEAVNAMLLNEFLKEHRKVEEQVRANQEQQANIAELKSAVAAQRDKTKALEVMLAEQAAQIRTVSAQLAASDQSLPRIVVNDQSTTR